MWKQSYWRYKFANTYRAGSERVAKTGTAGAAVKESGVINSSLLTLGVGE